MKRCISLAFIGIIGMCIISAHADIVEQDFSGWPSHSADNEFLELRVRYGSGKDGGHYEFAFLDLTTEEGRGGKPVAGTACQLEWNDNEPVPFTLIHNSSLNELDFTLGGRSTSLNSEQLGEGFGIMDIMVKANPDSRETVVHHNFGGGSTIASSDYPLASGKEQGGVMFYDDNGDALRDFTVNGAITLDWETSGDPSWEDLKTSFKFCSVPEPATFMLLGLGVFGMSLVSRRRKKGPNVV